MDMAAREKRKPKTMEAVPPPLATAPAPKASDYAEQPNDQARSRGAIDDHGMRCPECGCRESSVEETRRTYGHRIRRLRQCARCKETWTTFEKMAGAPDPDPE